MYTIILKILNKFILSSYLEHFSRVTRISYLECDIKFLFTLNIYFVKHRDFEINNQDHLDSCHNIHQNYSK